MAQEVDDAPQALAQEARWMKVKEPMAATIRTLLDMNWKPIHPSKCVPEGEQEAVDFNEVADVTAQREAHGAEAPHGEHLESSG